MIYVCGRHVRAGRKLIGWTVAQLAREAQVPPALIVSLEDDRLEPTGIVDRVARTLMRAGVRFLVLDECGMSGVWLNGPIASAQHFRRRAAGAQDSRSSRRAIRKGIEQRRLIGTACGLLKWNRRTLARRAGVAAADLRRSFQLDGPLPSVLTQALFGALRAAGVRFQPADFGCGPGAALVGGAAWAGHGTLVFVRHQPRAWE